MKSIMRNFICGLLLVLSGCAVWNSPYQPAPAPGSGQALVYFYRSPLISGHLWDTVFTIDGKPVAELNDKEYSWAHVPEGPRRFAARFHREKNLQVTRTLQAGETYYLEFHQEIIGKNRVRNVVEFVPAHAGSDRIKSFNHESEWR